MSFTSSKNSVSSIVPISPKLQTKIRAKNNRKIKTTQDLEIEQINIEKQKYDELRKLNTKNALKIRDTNVFEPVRSLQLTIPISPVLKTEIRAKKRNKLIEPEKKNNIINKKKKIKNKKKKKKPLKRKLTIPQSFKLNKSKTKCDKHLLTSDEIQLKKLILQKNPKKKKMKIKNE